MIGQNYPTIWKVITKIRCEIAANRANLALDEPGEQSTKRKKNEYANKIKYLMHTFWGIKTELKYFSSKYKVKAIIYFCNVYIITYYLIE